LQLVNIFIKELIKLNKKLPKYLKKCSICSEKFTYGNIRNKHLRIKHNLTFENYILKYCFDDKHPLCKCGCGKETKFNNSISKNWFPKYNVGHFRHEMTEDIKNKISKGLKTNFNNLTEDQKYKRREKRLIKLKQTNLIRYGVENTFQYEPFKEKSKSTNISNLGTEYASQNKDIREKIKKTCIDRYGVENPAQNIEIYQKVKDTNILKYGYESATQNREVQEKMKNTSFKNFGVEHYFSLENFKEKHSVKYSKTEIEICKKLGGESGFMFKGKEYDFKLGNNLFEIDGDFYHSTNLKNLNIFQLSSIVNDFNKINDCKDSEYNLYKILISNLPKEITVENLIKNSYVPNFELNYEDIIVSKEYIEKYLVRNGKVKSKKFINTISNIIQAFHPNIINLYKMENIKTNISNIIYSDNVLNITLNNIINKIYEN
jgi:hypothetical protein